MRPLWHGVLALVLATPLVLAGCAMQSLHQAQVNKYGLKLEPWEVERLGPVSGRSCRNEVMKAFTLSSPTLYEAELAAREMQPETELILHKNVYGEGETVIPFFWHRRCIYLEGIAVQLMRGGGR
jgi:hypothetical protein